METSGVLLEQVIQDCGGFGKYQLILVLFVLLSKLSCCWSMMMMALAGAKQDWWCQWKERTNTTHLSYETCSPPDNMTSNVCKAYIYDKNISTVITEWNLICDKDWVSSTTTTIQMSGLLLSGLACGHIADAIGRKPTYVLSLVLLLISNILAAFSISWQMFATLRFFSGLASGIFIAVKTVFLVEFVPQKSRGAITALPSWNLWVVAFAALGMWLHDWSKLHIAAGIAAAPFLIGCWYLPESFRWLVSKSRAEEANATIANVAKFNGSSPPDFNKINQIAEGIIKEGKTKQFTVLDLFNDRKYIMRTILLSISWIACAYGYYAISFGVEKLYGNIYVNLMLLNIVEIPTTLLQWHWINWLGRRKTSFGLFLIGGIGGLVVGSLQITDTKYKHVLITVFALVSKIGVSSGWEALVVWSSELYPTVIRNIGFGFVNTASRLGAMIAPQIVYLDKKLNGLMYFACGGMMMIAAICTLFLDETNNKALDDTVVDVTININGYGSIKQDRSDRRRENKNHNTNLHNVLGSLTSTE